MKYKACLTDEKRGPDKEISLIDVFAPDTFQFVLLYVPGVWWVEPKAGKYTVAINPEYDPKEVLDYINEIIKEIYSEEQ